MPSDVSPATLTLKDFQSFMRPDRYGSGWVLVESRSDMVRYEKTLPHSNGSCLIALPLLLLGLIPGILYLALARRPARTIRLTVTSVAGTLSPSGDAEALGKFRQFLNPKQYASAQARRNVILAIVLVAVFVWVVSVFASGSH